MEQKRTLWMVAAVGIFLLVVIGAALIFWRPAVKDPVISSVQNSQSSDTWMLPVDSGTNTALTSNQNANAINPLGDGASGQSTVANLGIANNSTQGNITIVETSDAIATNGAQQINLNTLQSNTASNSTTVSASNASTVASNTAASTASKPVTVTKPVTTTKPATSTKTASTTKTSTNTKASSQSPSSLKIEYWVQTGSFSSREYAENAQDSIAAYKIESEIFTKETNGKTWYRVRMGPYRTKTEADYWMTVIRSDPIFADSYITEVQTK